MRKRDLKDKAAVQAAVRQVADEYLKDSNITSVGVGYELKDGERTGRLALQFTVAEKLGLENLESVGTRRIPVSITVNGIEFATDVVERSFEKQPVLVKEAVKSERKQRLDPIAPGVSIGNARSTDAGTLGCLVREQVGGDLRLLSNWHVLHGEHGELGDAIVQPGAFDDNRVEVNRCGALVRSFLGLAGDCAIASLADRQAVEEILELSAVVRTIGDPELDDMVVKSGRTTGVTYGRVTRIHTISKLRYGSLGEQQIGSFEIGPDPNRPADNNEISMGGDSGSAWLSASETGQANEMMLGLHFAGETVEPAEYALACYASSVFEKLEIAVIEPVEGGAVIDTLTAGYQPEFLPGFRIELPSANELVEVDLTPTKAGELVRHYTHFTVAMSLTRRFCRWVAWNIDGNALQRLSREGIDFVIDPAYAPEHQVDDDLYASNRLDRGHIARRADLLWGSRPEAEQANIDSFFFTNITPQLDDFNQSGKRGLWGELENAIFEDVDVDDLKLSVFGGPIFKDTDFAYRGLLVPRSFWKLLCYVEAGVLRSKAFVLTQDDLEAKLESLGLEEFKLYQVGISELQTTLGLGFGVLAAADTLPAAPEGVDAPRVRRIERRGAIAAP